MLTYMRSLSRLSAWAGVRITLPTMGEFNGDTKGMATEPFVPGAPLWMWALLGVMPWYVMV